MGLCPKTVPKPFVQNLTIQTWSTKALTIQIRFSQRNAPKTLLFYIIRKTFLYNTEQKGIKGVKKLRISQNRFSQIGNPNPNLAQVGSPNLI